LCETLIHEETNTIVFLNQNSHQKQQKQSVRSTTLSKKLR